ncbi:MAG: HD-GYP domain-containing protein [Clostridia bacterium]|nr:HD-GYP domain-containing protein [Clostridia bacterium]
MQLTQTTFAIIVFVLVLIVLVSVIALAVKTRQALRREARYKKITLQAIQSVVDGIDALDPYSQGHSVRVAEYSVEIARRLKMGDLENIYFVALLHDIGKMNIPESVLKRSGRLSPDEYDLMKQHTEYGRQILGNLTAIPGVADGAKFHHERYDGSGYNEGLKGDEIPLIGRIIGVADAYDAMTSARSYRRGLSKLEAMDELKRCSGTQFDPKIADIMIQMINDGFIAS